MESEKDEVSLVVESGNLSTQKLRVLWEESSKHSADAVTQTSCEVVKNHLWIVFSRIFSSSLQREKSSTSDVGARYKYYSSKRRSAMYFFKNK